MANALTESTVVKNVDRILTLRSMNNLSAGEKMVVEDLYTMANPQPSDRTLALYIRLRRIEHRR